MVSGRLPLWRRLCDDGDLMSQWRSGTFWASLVAGWFVTMFALAVAISIFAPDDLSPAAGWALNVAHQAVSLLAGYFYARECFAWQESRRERSRGFPRRKK